MPDFGISTETGGITLKSGTASALVFNIPHDLGMIPTSYSCDGISEDSNSNFSYDVDVTNIIVTYPFPPPTGTDNLKFTWRAGA